MLFIWASVIGLLSLSIAVFSPKPRKPEPEELCYKTFDSRENAIPFDVKLEDDNAQVSFSLVIPAYNEELRICKMLEEAVVYLKNRQKQDRTFSFEIIVVDDGSRDRTCQIVLDFASCHPGSNIRLMKFVKNRGKGGAVTQGVLNARGSLILFADADGATTFADVEKLEKSIQKQGFDVAFGSRAHLVKSEAVIKRSFLRNFLMRAFHLYLFVLGASGIQDTQCGFKLFRRSAAAAIFPNIHVEGWIFDIEVLHIARTLNLKICEVAVNWSEIEGSKVSIIRDSIKMAIDLLIIKLNYLFGLWKVSAKRRRDKNE